MCGTRGLAHATGGRPACLEEVVGRLEGLARLLEALAPAASRSLAASLTHLSADVVVVLPRRPPGADGPDRSGAIVDAGGPGREGTAPPR